jgi:hypothetical protein
MAFPMKTRGVLKCLESCHPLPEPWNSGVKGWFRDNPVPGQCFNWQDESGGLTTSKVQGLRIEQGEDSNWKLLIRTKNSLYEIVTQAEEAKPCLGM